MSTLWLPYREPLRNTLLRNGLIAVVAGGIVAHFSGGLARGPVATLIMLWPTFGGHIIEVVFLNYLRPRLPAARPAEFAARLALWLLGGTLLALAMTVTATVVGFHIARQSWWLAGPAFIAIELIAHLFLQLRGRPSFYNGRG